MTSYIYTRFSPKNRAHPEQLSALKQLSPGSEVIEDQVRGNIPPFERPAFKELFDNLSSGDCLFVWWLTAFGRDFSQAKQTLESLLDRGVTIVTGCEALTLKADCPQTKLIMTLLSGYAKVQIQHRLFAAELGREELKGDPELWKSKFRGRPADKQKHQQVKAMLLEGNTIQSVADQCGVSVSTVKRVKAKLNQMDDEGCLRRRGRATESSGDPE
ncbi:recombinase family protein [Vibrio sp. SCSIO 43135]|uniref:recombinase family protein n=1 Tax=Vibrio sp. SCSIO 43135 TaxID=2819096 RepID=UPI0020761416|nr:recombinase family protein [Vibrio sp. SCSIO 43135]USD43289.1 recombinase family protein [Vibrio sp. SCSIO 43135]